jgi:hypothetical protein
MFGICGELWCLVVDLRLSWDLSPFVSAFTGSCAGDFSTKNVDGLWSIVALMWRQGWWSGVDGSSAARRSSNFPIADDPPGTQGKGPTELLTE